MKIEEINKILFDKYGDLNWWPAKTPYEVIVGAILTQNTAWSNVEKALRNFPEITPEFVLNETTESLAEIIRPSGFFNQKAMYLKAVTEWYGRYGFSPMKIRESADKNGTPKVRAELLNIHGVGRETADSILLYAFDLPVFLVDAYTKRLFNRMPVGAGKDYDEIRLFVEKTLDEKFYNNFHALIVINAKEYCRVKPFCEECPLNLHCEKIL
ncbi:MAG: endonuclease [Ruminococcus sp.]|jgi:endonuclease-3 related protein|nr:endonuclease [Ruminococcus sp.]